MFLQVDWHNCVVLNANTSLKNGSAATLHRSGEIPIVDPILILIIFASAPAAWARRPEMETCGIGFSTTDETGVVACRSRAAF